MTARQVLAAVLGWARVHAAWIITTFIAVYGAVLSTYREIQSRLEKKERIVVRFSTSMVVMDGAASRPYIQIRVEHHGGPSVIFGESCCNLKVDGSDTRLVLWDLKLTDVRQWPHELKAGMAFYVMSPRAELYRALNSMLKRSGTVRVRGNVQSQICKEYESDWVDLDINELQKTSA